MRLAKSIVLGLVCLSGGINVAQASGAYAAVQMSSLDYKETGIETLNPKVLMLRAGSAINEAVNLEGRFGLGLSEGEDSLTFMGTSIEYSVDVDNMIGMYVVANAPLNNTSNLYGVFGMTRVDLTASASVPNVIDISISDSDSDLSYGFGADIGISDTAALNVEYMSYYDEDDISIGGLAIGVKIKLQ